MRFAVVLGKRGLWVPRIDVRRSALGEDVNDVFGFGRKMGLPGQGRGRLLDGVRLWGEKVFAEQRGEAEGTKTLAQHAGGTGAE